MSFAGAQILGMAKIVNAPIVNEAMIETNFFIWLHTIHLFCIVISYIRIRI